MPRRGGCGGLRSRICQFHAAARLHHISHKSVPKCRFVPASPQGEAFERSHISAINNHLSHKVAANFAGIRIFPLHYTPHGGIMSTANGMGGQLWYCSPHRFTMATITFSQAKSNSDLCCNHFSVA